MNEIKVYVQSANGHDTIDATQASLSGIVAEQLKDDKWVTLEKTDGSTEILTKTDLPEASDKLDEDDDVEDSEDADTEDDGEELSAEDKKIQGWADTLTGKPSKPAKAATKTATAKFESRFENVVSATATHKAKGG